MRLEGFQLDLASPGSSFVALGACTGSVLFWTDTYYHALLEAEAYSSSKLESSTTRSRESPVYFDCRRVHVWMRVRKAILLSEANKLWCRNSLGF